jgi:hypothetical protein
MNQSPSNMTNTEIQGELELLDCQIRALNHRKSELDRELSKRIETQPNNNTHPPHEDDEAY